MNGSNGTYGTYEGRIYDNPFAPPSDAEPSLNDPYPTRTRSRSWLFRLGLWTVICSLSAGPSFVWGVVTVAQHQVLAMCLGVLVFIVAYTVADGVTANKSWRRDWAIRLTLRIGFIARMVISVVFPMGGFIDLYCGFISVRLVRLVLPIRGEFLNDANFVQTLAITLVQGMVLNAVLAGFMAIVYVIQLAIAARLAKRPPIIDSAERLV